MVRGVLISVALLGVLMYAVVRIVDMFQQAMPEYVTRIDIHSDRFVYRTNSYATSSLLEIGLKVAKDPPEKIGLHDCERMDELEDVVDIMRRLGYTNFEIELPRAC